MERVMVRTVLLQLIGFESNITLSAVCIISNNSAGITSTLHTFHIPIDTHKHTCTEMHRHTQLSIYLFTYSFH